MLSPIDFFYDLNNPALAFLPRALCVAIISAVVCAVVGTHVVTRSMAFIGDAVAHAVFPGIVIAFVLQTSILLGGALAGALVAILIAITSQKRTIKEDSLIGIFFAGAFAIGVLILSRVQGYTANLSSFLLGSIGGASTKDVIIVGIVSAIVITLTLVLSPRFIAITLDRETAHAMRLKVFWLDIALYLLVTASVVISVSTIGNILVLALLITPAATARLLSNHFYQVMLIAAAIGAVGSLLGVYLSWSLDFPTGAMIVVLLCGLFMVVWTVQTYRSR
ncbi:ABC transporter permease protein [Corynebacterium kutscheri]|uniref:ABC transporter permease protein n=1 Tax=Corynebacterium kutscheri TaxID=35755 RepID=A0A0F6R124_9CORY|nr:anchored repeat-type ABC transporter permease subunit [Corynebacterium kutscheri]AKE42062.1 anchored repeat-type ABC transporter, permease subunit [Corynebacterium kutscheri]VEH06065.1 ABC transporter permease protein [Corynebacterium kutscheri]VEH10403.1 ABC transporter permease protein [Corynebacterium kutscheri]VEH81979.1 ABC transporter permease protein [Corynebacterium kutscheri]